MVASAPARCGRRFYFIQSYEDWSGPADEVRATWQMPMEKLVIAQWLEDIARQLGEPSAFVPNAIDHKFFERVTSPADRGSATVLFQSMERELKGSADAVAAIEKLRKEGLNLEVLVFGRVDPSLFGLSQPYEFHYDPPQAKLVELYNRAAIYVTPSHIEGWSLTLAEAAACGAALVASDIGGHRDLAIAGRNALLFRTRDIDGLAASIRCLVLDAPTRLQLAEQSWIDVQVFDWDVASCRLELLLTQGIECAEPLSSRILIEKHQSAAMACRP
jgi:glycosyltransferase involved in cell wall biosynthesis